MCERLVQILEDIDFKASFGIENPNNSLPSNFNISPANSVFCVMIIEKKKTIIPLRWGLIPSWANNADIGYKLINTRLESLEDKDSVKALKNNRVLVLANGFYCWKSENTKQPYYIHYKERGLVCFAGLAEFWVDPKTQEVIRSCTIITSPANEQMKDYNNRMPIVVDKNDYDTWLDPNINNSDILLDLLNKSNNVQIEAYPVSIEVNSARNNSISLLDRINI